MKAFVSIASLLIFASLIHGAQIDWSEVDSILQNAIKDGAFPGCVALVGDSTGALYMKAFGSFTYGEPAPLNGNNPPMTLETVFDMASLTKVLATTTAMAQFYQRGQLDLDMPLADEYLLGKAFANGGKEAITVRNILLHNAGFPPDPSPNYWEPGFGCPATAEYHPPEDYSCQQRIYSAYMQQPLAAPVGSVCVYSDLSMIGGMYVVGNLAKRLKYVSVADLRPGCDQGEPANSVCYYEAYVRLYVLKPLAMASSGFLPPLAAMPLAAPTWNDTSYTHRVMQGTVSDGNAYALGGISGHAGLFSTIRDVDRMLWEYLTAAERVDGRYLDAATVHEFTKAYNVSFSSRALGWDTNNPSALCGSLSLSTYTHTGYTGTQVCVDPDRKIYTSLLTNRVYPDTSNVKIAQVRPAFNSAVQRAWDSANPAARQRVRGGQ